MNHLNPDMIKCLGCGAVVQDQDSKKEGYIPSSAFNKIDGDSEVYCQRCFKLRHYNELVDIEMDEESYKSILNEISQKKALVVMVVDLFDFEGTFIQGLQRFAMDNPILIVGNKMDLFPKSVKESTIKHWIMLRAHEMGLRPADILVTSAKKNLNVDLLMKTMEELRAGQDVYVLGASNVGKSSLINAILGGAVGDKDLITTSYFPGTTLGKIEIPLDDNQVLVDTPGIIQAHQVTYLLEGKDVKKVTPRHELRPRIYQLNAGQSLFISGLARLDIQKAEGKVSAVVYAARGLPLHRTKTEKAAGIEERLVGTELVPPSKNETGPIIYQEQQIKVQEKSDLLISGLGWVTISPNTTVNIKLPKSVKLTLRPAMI